MYMCACATLYSCTLLSSAKKVKGRELYCHTCFLTRKESFGDTAFIFFTTFTENSNRYKNNVKFANLHI